MSIRPVDIGVLVAYFVATILVGLWVSKRGSKDMDSYFLGGKSPQDRLAELKEQKLSLDGLRKTIQDTLPNMAEAELLSYTERQRLYGEWAAMRWLQERRNATGGQKSP